MPEWLGFIFEFLPFLVSAFIGFITYRRTGKVKKDVDSLSSQILDQQQISSGEKVTQARMRELLFLRDSLISLTKKVDDFYKEQNTDGGSESE